MDKKLPKRKLPVASWHKKLLIAAIISTTLLIAMGGILCVTQSIRSCPDWPGCFGKILPPMEVSPILEMTHRLVAGISGLLILAAAIAGAIRSRRLRWIMIPPILTSLLVLEVSYLGAQVVIRGISPGWAAVDLGSALLVPALLVASAVFANVYNSNPSKSAKLTFRSPFSRLVLAITVIIYGVLVSGVLVAGQNSITSCLCWPIYSKLLYQVDLPGVGNIFRLVISVIGIALIVSVMIQAWRTQRHQPVIFRNACWLGVIFLLEMLLQVLLLGFDYNIYLKVTYTVTMAAFWSILVTLAVNAGIEVRADGQISE
jgi:cytochrome c oxidase assembly protein subunit 15